MEKQRTVPASYPLTLNALRIACNQTSSRDPIVDYDEATVEGCTRQLKQRELLRIVIASRGVRTLKYHERLTERLDLAADEAALITVLLLRGPQSPGELKTRTERLHAFADRDAVEACLHRLAARVDPLVHELPRRPGQHDPRWAHLLGPQAAVDVAAEPPPDLEVVLQDGAEARDARVRAAYDAVAEAYAGTYDDELASKPFDTWLLDRIAAVAGTDPVCDVGTGPGHIPAYLAAAGVDVTGVDISPAMIEQARTRHPEVTFELADLRRLLRPRAAAGWGAITSWYSLIHLAPSELPDAVAALARTLRPGGGLALALHVGGSVDHGDTWFDQDVSLDVVRHDPATVRSAVEASGLVIDEWYICGPATGVVLATERMYVLAHRPGS